MTTYRITNIATGHAFGEYEADSPDAALLAMVRDSGYASVEEAREELEEALQIEPVAEGTIVAEKFTQYITFESSFDGPTMAALGTTPKAATSAWRETMIAAGRCIYDVKLTGVFYCGPCSDAAAEIVRQTGTAPAGFHQLNGIFVTRDEYYAVRPPFWVSMLRNRQQTAG